MKIVKLTSRALTVWNKNTSYLVDAEGECIRRLHPDEERVLGAVKTRAATQRKTIDTVLDIAVEGRVKKLAVKCMFAQLGRNRDEYRVTMFVDGLQLVSGRDVFCAEMLATHGECQLRHPNGVVLKVIRDPSKVRPSLAQASQLAPHPNFCECASWGVPHPEVHHQHCPWNRLAPPEQQAPAHRAPEAIDEVPKQRLPSLALKGPALQGLPSRSNVARVDLPEMPLREASGALPLPTTNVTLPPPAIEVVPNPAPRPMAASANPDPSSPEECKHGCSGWATPKNRPTEPGHHHPMCPEAKAWAIKIARTTPRYVVDLMLGQVVRLAEEDEIAKASVAEQKTGVSVITINDHPFAILKKDELDETQAQVADMVTALAFAGAHEAEAQATRAESSA